MPMFVDPNARVPVTDGINTIYIRAKMSAETLALLRNEVRQKIGQGDGDSGEIRGMGTYGLLLRVHNIVAWEGPDFVDEKGNPIPCTRANICKLDPTHPLYAMVGERIGELNTAPESPDPN